MGHAEAQHLSNPFPACSLCRTGLGPGLRFAASAPRWQHPHPKTTPSPFGLLCSLNTPLKPPLPPLKPPSHRHAANAGGEGPPARDTPSWELALLLGARVGCSGKSPTAEVTSPKGRRHRDGWVLGQHPAGDGKKRVLQLGAHSRVPLWGLRRAVRAGSTSG